MAMAQVRDPVFTQFLAEKLPILQARFAPELLVLSRSRARNQGRPDSDIGLLIAWPVFRGIKWPLRASEVLLALRHPGGG